MDKIRFFLKKKYIIVIGVSIIVLIPGIVTGIVLFKPQRKLVSLNINGCWGPLKLDPIEAREPPSVWVINQL